MTWFDMRRKRRNKGISIREMSQRTGINRGVLSLAETERILDAFKAASVELDAPIELTLGEGSVRMTLTVDGRGQE